MRQILCDRCHEPIDPQKMWANNDGQLVQVGIVTGGEREDAMWHEYHRGCARDMLMGDVYARTGLLPL